MHTVTATCTYEGPSMANNLPACAVLNNSLEKIPLPLPSNLQLVEMLCQENSIGWTCMGSELASSSLRFLPSLASTNAAIWTVSEIRRSMRLRDFVTHEQVTSAHRGPKQLVRSVKVICYDRCLAFSATHALDARDAPVLRPLHASARKQCICWSPDFPP